MVSSLASSILQLVELRPFKTLAQRDELGVAPAFPHLANACRQIAERRNLGSKLVQLDRSRRFVHERVAGRLIQIVVILLRIGKPARKLGKPPGALRRG